MSHEIAQSAITGEEGRYLCAYKRDASEIWHAQETKPAFLPADATDDDVMVAGGIRGKYQRTRVRYYSAPDKLETMEDSHVIIAPQTKAPIGIVSDGFQLVQPEPFRQLARDIAQVIDGHVDSAFVSHGGACMVVNIRAGEAIRIVGNDILLPNFMVATRNDGRMNTTGKATDIRPICDNTMRAALATGQHARDFRLSHRSEFDPKRLAAYWAASLEAHKAQTEALRLLAQTPVQHATADEFVFDLLNAKRDAAAQADPKRDIRNGAGYKTIMGLFAGAGRGAMLPGVKGTAWGMLNAVTEYADHHAQAKSLSHRWESAQFGRGADLKDSAFAKLMELATAE